jgi:hypothetical protein
VTEPELVNDHRPFQLSKYLGAVRASGIGVAEAESLSEAEVEQRVFGPTLSGTPGAFVADIISTTKSNHWKYEKEIRAAALLVDAEREGNRYFSTVDIRGIVLGALSKISEEQIRDALPPGKSVKVTWARLAFGSYGAACNWTLPDRLR